MKFLEDVGKSDNIRQLGDNHVSVVEAFKHFSMSIMTTRSQKIYHKIINPGDSFDRTKIKNIILSKPADYIKSSMCHKYIICIHLFYYRILW